MTIVSFSGIDGAGKSTQIDALESWLRQAGLRTQRINFWDHVAVFSTGRERLSRKLLKGDQGVGSPEKPVARRDKNVTSWPVLATRLFFYLADAFNLRRKIREFKKNNIDVLICDRYIYDELANLPLHRPPARIFARLVLKLSPAPDLAFLIDADPVAALARKPEYPLDFLRRNREAYLTLPALAPEITVIEPGFVEMVKANIRQTTLRKLAATPVALHDVPVLD